MGLNLQFVVKKYTSSQKEGESTIHKVVLKHKDGHKLELKGDKSIRQGFPLGEIINVSVNSRKTLDELMEE